MRLPWQRREVRASGGDFTDAVVRLIEAQAAGAAADASSTAAVEAAAGTLSRAFAAAEVTGPDWATSAVSPMFLAQVGRDLIRSGASLHVVRVTGDRVRLLPAASWHFEGDHDPDSWIVRATAYGPSTSTTWSLPASGVVFVRWGGTPGQPYVGVGPTGWAHTTARLGSEVERSLADEAAGPLAQLLAVPQDGGKPRRRRRRRRPAGEPPRRPVPRPRPGATGRDDGRRMGRGPRIGATTRLASGSSRASASSRHGRGGP